jgi:hypothetical protein
VANGLRLTVKVVDKVWEPEKVLAAAATMKRKNLYKTGALVRTIARNSIRRGKGKAPLGAPPVQHTNPGLKLIKFSVDTALEDVTVYTEPFDAIGINVPKVLEFGGYQETKATKGRKQRRSKFTRHPFLAPAEEKARATYPDLWANSFG